MVVGVLIFSVFFVCFIGVEECVFMVICVCVGGVRWVDVRGGHDARGSRGVRLSVRNFLAVTSAITHFKSAAVRNR